MRTILPSEFQPGLVLLLEGAPHTLEEFHTTGTAKTKHRVHARLRNLITGRQMEHSFPEGERVAVAETESRTIQYSYVQGDRYVFLDSQTFEEISLSRDQIGERHWFLKENGEYRAVFIEGRLLDIVLPEHMDLKVIETAPPQRSTQTSAGKTAKLEGGLEIIVPLFIGPGETIRVDTRTRKYAGKAGG